MIELIRSIYNIKDKHHGCVATIGNFDGIHLGHQKVLQQLKTKAYELNLPSLVITFEPLPQEYFQKDAAPARLLRLREKLLLFNEFEIDRVLCLRFNQQLANLSAENFVTEILVKKLGVKSLIVGDDFRFGYQRRGDFVLLTKLGKEFDFQVTDTETVLFNGQRVGSSVVRAALANSDFSLTKQLLGRSYTIEGRVIYGDQRGRQLGFPTINIPLRRRVIPLQGVFTVLVHGIENNSLTGVANVGRRPTVGDDHRLLEVYLLNFNKEIYGRYVQVEFLQKLRDEQRFASLDELKKQIAQDVIKARNFFTTFKL